MTSQVSLESHLFLSTMADLNRSQESIFLQSINKLSQFLE